MKFPDFFVKTKFLRVLSEKELNLVFSIKCASKIWRGVSEIRLEQTRLLHLVTSNNQLIRTFVRNSLLRVKSRSKFHNLKPEKIGEFLSILLISSAYPNSHIFVWPKRVWLFAYVWLVGLWLFGGSTLPKDAVSS